MLHKKIKVINLDLNKLYLISGVSFSGKSHFASKLVEAGIPPQAIISSDKIREQIYGTYFTADPYGIKEHVVGWSIHSDKAYDILERIMVNRLLEDLPVFFDSTSLDEHTRQKWANLAKTFKKETEIIILDVPKNVILERSKKRIKRFDFSTVKEQLVRFKKTSSLPYQIIYHEHPYQINFYQNLLLNKDILVVGNLCGAIEDIALFLNKHGWEFKNERFLPPNKTQKILFLGNVITHAKDSFEILRVIMNTSNDGNCHFILGKDEATLLKTYKCFKENKETLPQKLPQNHNQLCMFFFFLELEHNQQQLIIDFLERQKSYFQLWLDKNNYPTNNIHLAKQKILFVHGAIESFQPFNFSKYFATWGQGGNQALHNYDKNYELKINNHLCIVGEALKPISSHNYIYLLGSESSLKSQANLALLNLASFVDSLFLSKECQKNIFLEHTFFFKAKQIKNPSIHRRAQFLKEINKERENLIIKEVNNIIYLNYRNSETTSNIIGIQSTETVGYDLSGRICIRTMPKPPSVSNTMIPHASANNIIFQKYISKLCYIAKHPFLEKTIRIGTGLLASVPDKIIQHVENTILKININYTYVFCTNDHNLYLVNVIDNNTNKYLFKKVRFFASILNILYIEEFDQSF